MLIALDGARHAGGPQQLITQVAINELVQVEQVLQQLPAAREGGGHQLYQRFGKVGRDVYIRQGGAEVARMRSGCQDAIGAHTQRLLLDTLASALQDLRLTTVDEGRQTALKNPIDAWPAHGAATIPPRLCTRRINLEGLTLASMRYLPEILACYTKGVAPCKGLRPPRARHLV